MSAFDRRVDPEVREVRRARGDRRRAGGGVGGAPRRRRGLLAESLAPRVGISEVARRYDLRLQQLFAWRHQAKQGRLALPAAELSFVPVVGAVVRVTGLV
jgi:transposase